MEPLAEFPNQQVEAGGLLRSGILIDGQCNDAEHQMAHYFGRTAYPHRTAPELIFQTRIHPFYRGAFVVAQVLSHAIAKKLAAFLLGSQLRFEGLVAARMNVDDGDVPQSADVLMDGSRIVGGIHQVIEICNSLGSHLRQRNRCLTIMQRCGS